MLSFEIISKKHTTMRSGDLTEPEKHTTFGKNYETKGKIYHQLFMTNSL